MDVLLDTHIYLWWLTGDRRLKGEALRVISDPAVRVHISAASVWEAGIKAGIGRLDVRDADLVAEIDANDFEHLPITADHAWAASVLPRHHDDPFDRMLIAQAGLEELVFITDDEVASRYDVALLTS